MAKHTSCGQAHVRRFSSNRPQCGPARDNSVMAGNSAAPCSHAASPNRRFTWHHPVHRGSSWNWPVEGFWISSTMNACLVSLSTGRSDRHPSPLDPLYRADVHRPAKFAVYGAPARTVITAAIESLR